MISFPDDDDGHALEKVASSGNDMGKPMPIDFFVAVPDEDAGHRVAMVAAELGYEVAVDYDRDEDAWTCYCTKRMIPTHAGVIACQAELDRAAKSFGGYTDGWGTFGNKSEPQQDGE